MLLFIGLAIPPEGNIGSTPPQPQPQPSYEGGGGGGGCRPFSFRKKETLKRKLAASTPRRPHMRAGLGGLGGVSGALR